MDDKKISTMIITALSMMPSGLDDIIFKKPAISGFKHQDLTNTASQPIKSSHNSKQRKKSKRNRKGWARAGSG